MNSLYSVLLKSIGLSCTLDGPFSMWFHSIMHWLCTCACSVTQSCLTLCNPLGCSPPGSSVHGISQARTLESVAISYSRGSSRLWDRTCVSCISCTGRQILYHEHQLGNPMHWSLENKTSSLIYTDFRAVFTIQHHHTSCSSEKLFYTPVREQE